MGNRESGADESPETQLSDTIWRKKPLVGKLPTRGPRERMNEEKVSSSRRGDDDVALLSPLSSRPRALPALIRVVAHALRDAHD